LGLRTKRPSKEGSKSKRQEFREFIAKEKAKDLVFVDESGI
jgi:hypothetical protein